MGARRDTGRLESLRRWMMEAPRTIDAIMGRHQISRRTAYHWVDCVGGKRVRLEGGGFAYRVRP